MTLCIVCDNRHDCDILIKLREIAEMYDIKMNVKIEECAGFK
jgi:hypothetical protein